nr:unnamed protein product [Callosobruchus chinensis]
MEAANSDLAQPLVARNARAAFSTGVHERTISKIRKEDAERKRTNLQQQPSLPEKKRPRPSVLEKKEKADFYLIRKIIEKFYCEYKVVPTCRKLLIKVREEMEFSYSRESLRLLLKANGFYTGVLLSSSRSQLRIITRHLTGYYRLKEQMNEVGLYLGELERKQHSGFPSTKVYLKLFCL